MGAVIVWESGVSCPAALLSRSLGNDGTFSFNVQLLASRRGDDRDGRTYTITIAAQTAAGAIGSATTIVMVPHNR
jgi:hypothetical protein